MNTTRRQRFIAGALIIMALSMGVWTWARAREERGRQKPFTISGVVSTVDVDRSIITVRIRSTAQRALVGLRGNSQAFAVVENARIATRGQPRAKLKDIANGDRVTVHGKYRGGTFVVDRIVAGDTRYLQKFKKPLHKSPTRAP